MRDDDLRQKNARLREKIKEISDRHPELRDLSDEIALEQGAHVEMGTSFLDRVNGKLASFESIKKFKILADEFTIETGELTPSLKIRRRFCNEKYSSELDSMYGASAHA